MRTTARLTLTATVLNSPEPIALAHVYQRLLGWEITDEDPTWVKLVNPEGGAGLSFQIEDIYERPVWPAEAGKPQDDVRVHLGPDGHPFCLFAG